MEVQWVIVFPGQRTEEAPRPLPDREDGEFKRPSAALSGKSGEDGREDFPALSVT